MKFEPIYISYRNRSWNKIAPRMYLYIGITLFSLPFKKFIFIIPLANAIVLYRRSQQRNINYINALSIDDEFVELDVFQYDERLDKIKVPREMCHVELNEINLGLFSLLEITFYKKELRPITLFKQVETGEWDEKKFKEICKLLAPVSVKDVV